MYVTTDMDQVRKREDCHVQAAWFAAGAVVLAVCWQCVGVVPVFERWRMWVFAALNIVLLAILFTSTCSTMTTDTSSECETKEGRKRRESKRRKKPRRETVERVEGLNLVEKSTEGKGVKKVEIAEGDEGAKLSHLSLSEDELNERVEAFITMFKQQLISDAKGRKERTGSKQYRIN